MAASFPQTTAPTTAASVRSPFSSAPDNQGDLFPLEVRIASPGWIAPFLHQTDPLSLPTFTQGRSAKQRTAKPYQHSRSSTSGSPSPRPTLMMMSRKTGHQSENQNRDDRDGQHKQQIGQSLFDPTGLYLPRAKQGLVEIKDPKCQRNAEQNSADSCERQMQGRHHTRGLAAGKSPKFA